MDDEIRHRLRISPDRLEAINAVLLDPDMGAIDGFFDVVAKYGTPEEINRKAARAMHLPSLLERVGKSRPDYLADLEWLEKERNLGVFISEADYRRKVLGDRVDEVTFDDDFAVTLEISACQYLPWVIEVARRAIEQQSLMPGRFIRVRKMK